MFMSCKLMPGWLLCLWESKLGLQFVFVKRGFGEKGLRLFLLRTLCQTVSCETGIIYHDNGNYGIRRLRACHFDVKMTLKHFMC